MLRLLGLAARAGAVAAGTGPVRDSVRAGRAVLVLVAVDASANTRDRLMPLMAALGVRPVEGFSRDELGRAVGRAPVAAVAVEDRSLGARIRELTDPAADNAAP